MEIEENLFYEEGDSGPGKETKNKIRYDWRSEEEPDKDTVEKLAELKDISKDEAKRELTEEHNPIISSLYIHKRAFDGKPPEKITLKVSGE